MAALVSDQNAVGIAVERDADVGAHLAHLAAQFLRRRRAAVAVDVEAVGLDTNRDHLGAQLPERLRHHLVGGAMGTQDVRDLHPLSCPVLSVTPGPHGSTVHKPGIV